MKYFIRSILITSMTLFATSAMADVEVIVHPSNGAALDQDTIQRIFLGKTRAFPGGGEAVAISVKDDTPVANEFTEKVLAKSPKQLKAYWAKMVFTGKGTPPKQVESAANVVELVSNNPNLIGFVPAGSAGGGVKVVGKF